MKKLHVPRVSDTNDEHLASHRMRPGEEDGILTALEVSEMDLSRLELAMHRCGCSRRACAAGFPRTQRKTRTRTAGCLRFTGLGV
jgi:hypothetical protein